MQRGACVLHQRKQLAHLEVFETEAKTSVCTTSEEG